MSASNIEASAMPGRDCDVALAADPFTALKAHFGMLLGVADFQTIDAYHRGKQWLHNAWLHRHGVVWGFEVTLDTPGDEIRVAPGLAIDALGRELYLAQPVCLNLPAWLEKHGEEADVQDHTTPSGTGILLNAHVVIQFQACLGRQVPALMEPCDGGGATTAYSRVRETVEVSLVPGPAPVVGGPGRPLPYHRLRLLFGLEDPLEVDGSVIETDQVVLDRRAQILSLDHGDQPRAYLEAFREFAALECMAMGPADSAQDDPIALMPGSDPAPLVLADLSDLLVRNQDFRSGEIDNTVRQTHVATSTIQELLCGPLFAPAPGETPAPDGEPPVVDTPEDAGGPRVDRESVELDGNEVRMVHEGPRLLANSLEENVSVSASIYDVDSGWQMANVARARYDATQKQITVELSEAPDQEFLRIELKGTGLMPVLSQTNRVPLAGEVGGAPGNVHQGNDFVHMINMED
jgi:hypothetical protein